MVSGVTPAFCATSLMRYAFAIALLDLRETTGLKTRDGLHEIAQAACAAWVPHLAGATIGGDMVADPLNRATQARLDQLAQHRCLVLIKAIANSSMAGRSFCQTATRRSVLVYT
jgi:hypothetical protein